MQCEHIEHISCFWLDLPSPSLARVVCHEMREIREKKTRRDDVRVANVIASAKYCVIQSKIQLPASPSQDSDIIAFDRLTFGPCGADGQRWPNSNVQSFHESCSVLFAIAFTNSNSSSNAVRWPLHDVWMRLLRGFDGHGVTQFISYSLPSRQVLIIFISRILFSVFALFNYCDAFICVCLGTVCVCVRARNNTRKHALNLWFEMIYWRHQMICRPLLCTLESWANAFGHDVRKGTTEIESKRQAPQIEASDEILRCVFCLLFPSLFTSCISYKRAPGTLAI